MATLEQMIAVIANDALQTNIWPRSNGGFQANVKERAGDGWTVVCMDDPVAALREALWQRHTAMTGRYVRETPQAPPAAPVEVPTGQIDIDDVLAAGAAPADFEEMFG